MDNENIELAAPKTDAPKKVYATPAIRTIGNIDGLVKSQPAAGSDGGSGDDSTGS